MKDLIFEHYFHISTPVILTGWLLVAFGMLVWPSGNRWKDALLAVVIYIAIVALGMSGNIKHLSPIGIAHALIAFWIAWLAIRHYQNRTAYLFLVPCCFILIVIGFNLVAESRGLELMGRWSKSSLEQLDTSLRR